MIDLGTLAGLHARQHELHAYCATCDRWSVLPLATLIENGMGDRRLPLRVRCRWCAAVGEIQVRPPMPARSSTGWIAPPSVAPNDDACDLTTSRSSFVLQTEGRVRHTQHGIDRATALEVVQLLRGE